MAEYTNVERPFLDKLRQCGWHVIDQGPGIPQEPERSLRTTFKEVILFDEFKKAIRKINLTPVFINLRTIADLFPPYPFR